MEDGIPDGHVTVHPCAGCVSRRAFLGQSALVTATAAFLAACGDGQIGPTGIARSATPVVVKVADFAGLATVGTLVDINFSIAAKRTGAATFVAFSRVCPHQQFQINLEGSGFHCFAHDSFFNNDGQVTGGPAPHGLDKVATSYDPVTDLLTLG